MNYYGEIKKEFINNELNKKVKDYSKNKSDLNTYKTKGKLLIEAQGGEKRAKYGNGLIREYSKRLTEELGKGYSVTNLKNMRSFYVVSKSQTLSDLLTWSHYTELLKLNNVDEINYYMNMCLEQNLSVRQLRERIKSKEYEHLDDKTKNKLIKKEETTIGDLIKNPIIIKNTLNMEKITEKALQLLILENLTDFLHELGPGFSFIGNEYKIRFGNRDNYIDLLLFNYIYNAFVVIELKITELKKEHIGQIQVYMNYVDKYIKRLEHNNTIGIIICKRDNHFVIEYTSNPNIFRTVYKISV